MFWFDRWRAISARIGGLVSAGDLMASALKVNSSDVYSVVRNSIAPTLKAINADLRSFQRDCGSALPEAATDSLRTQKELPLDAPVRDHVHPPRDDSTRHRHPFSSARPPHRCAEINLGCGPLPTAVSLRPL